MQRHTWIMVIVIGFLGFALSTTLFLRLRGLERNQLKNVFQRIVDERAASLERQMSLNIEALFSLEPLFGGTHSVNHELFSSVARGILSRHPDIHALEWIPRIPDGERKSAETARQDLFPSFHITEMTEQDGMHRAQQREEYYPVYFVEPYKGNEEALGFDLGSNPVRLAAIRESHASGMVQFTASIKLVQEKESQRGVLAFVPVYKGKPSTSEERRGSLRGFVLGVYRIGDIFTASIFEDSIKGIEMILIDETEGDSPTTLFHHRSHSLEKTIEEIQYRRPLKELGGRQWAITASPTPSFLRNKATKIPLLVFLLGIVLTLGMIAYVVVLTKRGDIFQKMAAERRHNEEALSKALEFSEKILSESPIGMTIFDAESGQCVTSNRAMREVIGAEVEDMPKQNLYDMKSWEKTGLSEVAKSALKDNSKRQQEANFRTTFHKDVSADCNFAPFYVGDKKYLLCAMLDITERKEAEEKLIISDFRLKKVIEASGVVVWDWNINTDKLDWDDSYYQTFGYLAEDTLPTLKSWSDFIHPDDAEETLAELHRVIESNDAKWIAEYRFKKKNGTYAVVLDWGTVTYDKKRKPARMIGAMLDISQRKLAEEELKEAHGHLEQRVQERTRELMESNTKLERETIERNRAEGERERLSKAIAQTTEAILITMQKDPFNTSIPPSSNIRATCEKKPSVRIRAYSRAACTMIHSIKKCGTSSTAARLGGGESSISERTAH